MDQESFLPEKKHMRDILFESLRANFTLQSQLSDKNNERNTHKSL